MKERTTLSIHARMRLTERTRLSEAELVQLLDEGRSASVAYRRGITHWHRIVYSFHDENYFVAISDVRNGEVITVIPIHFYEETFGPISPKPKQKALQRADLSHDISISFLPSLGETPPQCCPT